MSEELNTIKVIVLSQTLKLNGKSYSMTCLPVGTILDAIPKYYGKNNSIMNYQVFFTEEQIKKYRFYNDWTFLPPEIVKPLAKHREDIINSILDD
jgi:hypothetical protein